MCLEELMQAEFYQKVNITNALVIRNISEILVI